MVKRSQDSIRVIVRTRPLLYSEHDHKCSRIELESENGRVLVKGKSSDDARCFQFDRVFQQSAQQDDIMEEVEPLIDHVIDGFHATLFAYGQTGSGKTYTVDGIERERSSGGESPLAGLSSINPHDGIIPRAIYCIYNRVRELETKHEGIRLKVKCSYYQLYNERVTDLLTPPPARSLPTSANALRIGWYRGNNFKVENLTYLECETAEEMRRAFLAGAREKAMWSNGVNQQSSRSHCVFTIYVERWCTNSSEKLCSELSLIDLAGSEKMALLEKNPSSVRRESIEINASLLALGKVITALADVSKRRTRTGNSSARSHIPYRDSKLTKLLKHALGGNSLTTMIACISPSDRYVDETVSTLLYAGRARNIKNVPRLHEDPKSTIIRLLREENALMKKELEYYRSIASGGSSMWA